MLFTAQFQILQGENQKVLQMNASQINHANSPASCILCGALAFLFETGRLSPESNVLTHEFQDYEMVTIFASCILAALVNLTSYGLIGKTSSVTYQVIGHAKVHRLFLYSHRIDLFNFDHWLFVLPSSSDHRPIDEECVGNLRCDGWSCVIWPCPITRVAEPSPNGFLGSLLPCMVAHDD